MNNTPHNDSSSLKNNAVSKRRSLQSGKEGVLVKIIIMLLVITFALLCSRGGGQAQGPDNRHEENSKRAREQTGIDQQIGEHARRMVKKAD